MGDLKFTKGGLVGKGDRVLVLLEPGTTYISKGAFKKYGSEFFKKINGGQCSIIVDGIKVPGIRQVGG